jgi:hypothetical protein
MGQISDDIVDGLCCNFCGQYFEDEHGYPVVCGECWDELPKRDRAGLPKATFRLIADISDEEWANHPNNGASQ